MTTTRERLEQALGCLRGLMEWAPNDLGEGLPDVWIEASDLLFSVKRDGLGTSVLALDGVEIELSRSKRDNRIMVEIDTAGTEVEDEHPGRIPKLRLVVNGDVGNLNAEGQFDWSTP